MPEGPPVWICGDCHVGNLGPVANVKGASDFDAAAPTVKQLLVALRMLFDYLIIQQVMPTNPACGPKHSMKKVETAQSPFGLLPQLKNRVALCGHRTSPS